ncbi:MAG: cytochrome C [Candidatus Eremiobacter antarcticus]|nr:cbb3-type cytochrome c oxidase subunit I [Candidatus Eremiobacteraeota bacterium]MBC5809019.1 cbb3-type cytochrome c oxidase subunit I [Candidatus Eremiobacteraeota bacterium]PZR60308.1 MAG: cytochrome C [Candidatus Eremiobacter sp. RRmetagenome_bin22]
MMEAHVRRENRLVLAHLYVATLALMLGAVFGLLQSLSRARWVSMPSSFDYYRMLTAHGVLMAIVFTTFFIVGLATLLTYRAIPRDRSLALGWSAFWLMTLGTLAAAATILSGNASVLYTFYAPLKAHPAFYLGTTVLVVGTWLVLIDILANAVWFWRTQPGRRLPLVVHGSACTFVMWFIATIGVAIEMLFFLIPWSLGWTPTVNVMMTRMLFWYFGHPLVYFWIMGAYLIWYNIIPLHYGGKIFSDALTRVAFLLLLILSTPVGIHHQFLEPGIAAGWKWLHTMNTYGVVVPSIMTAFVIFASFEMAAQRKGVKGFWATIRSLPWTNPAFTGPALGMILFIFGGFGGIVNASYSMDAIVHNTMWIVGHFHITVGGPVALTFVGTAYWLIPRLTGRRLFAPKLALAQTYTWFVGMAIMSTAMHWAGLLGSPRRTDDVTYFGVQAAAAWMPHMRAAAIGGSLLFLSILMFAAVAFGTLFTARDETQVIEVAQVEEHAALTPAYLDRIGTWATVAVVLAVLAYVGPMHELLEAHVYGAPGMRTW